MKVSDGLYAYIWRDHFENNCNMFYIGNPHNVLIDPGLKKYIDLHFEEMKSDGLDPDGIRYVLNTHSHPDHFDGSLYFMEKGVPVGMHEREIEFVKEIGPAFYSMFGMEFPDFTFDLKIKEGPLTLGELELQIVHTPGHSPGSISIYWEDTKALFCGDLIFRENVGRVDFPGGDAAQLALSIEKLSSLDIEYLFPGHMEYISGKKNVEKNFDFIKNYILSNI